MAPKPMYEDEETEEEDDEVAEEVVAPTRKRGGKKAAKDPDRPKRALSAFFLYSQANRPRVKEENPEAAFGELARILARQYKELTPSEMKQWEKKAEQDKSRYQDEMKSYVPAPEYADAGGGSKKKQKKDPNAPKRNMSAYFLYSIDTRPTIKAENPSASFGDIARMISANFKALSEDDRKEWDEKAVADKERYEREMALYRENA